ADRAGGQGRGDGVGGEGHRAPEPGARIAELGVGERQRAGKGGAGNREFEPGTQRIDELAAPARHVWLGGDAGRAGQHPDAEVVGGAGGRTRRGAALEVGGDVGGGHGANGGNRGGVRDRNRLAGI